MRDSSETESVSAPGSESLPGARVPGLDRRRFLGGVGGATVAALAAGSVTLPEVADPPAADAAEITPQNPHQRKASSFHYRVDLARRELIRPVVHHDTNGDEELYPSKIGNFSKTLPHDGLGEVDPAAYAALQNALASGEFDDFEAIPAGGTATLANPLGGLAFDPSGPDGLAVGVPAPPPPLASPEWAAQMAELYWMALLRDVALSEFDSDPLALAARQSLGAYSGYTGPRDSGTGQIGAEDLFRLDYPGVRTGPLVSQFLLRAFAYDSIPIDPRISTPAAGQDFVTAYPEWLAIQRGNPPGGAIAADPVLRYPRTVRDLGQLAQSDRIYSQYFRALIILSTFGNAFVDDANPYKSSTRQSGFATFGLAQATELVGLVHKSERHTWYHKWFVHRFLRPEAGGGRVHNAKTGAADYPIHADLLDDDDLLDRVFESNRQRNLARPEIGQNVGTYLLSIMSRGGGPSHPAFPAGHAVSAGACITFLKAWFKESVAFPNPVEPTPDGLSLVPYIGPTLTIGGELNKLCHNLSLGRDMSGVHWRADTDSGNFQGEEVAIRILREVRRGVPEPFAGFTLQKFDGTTITV